jgi:hypothetical protein
MRAFDRTAIVVVLVMPALAYQPFSWANETTEEVHDPAKVVPIKGTELARITLTDKAAERLDIRTAKVAQDPKGRTITPYAALLYDINGGVWVYTTEGHLTFVRHEVVVDSIEGERVALKDGPPAGAEVVTVGVPELYGIEKGVGE